MKPFSHAWWYEVACLLRQRAERHTQAAVNTLNTTPYHRSQNMQRAYHSEQVYRFALDRVHRTHRPRPARPAARAAHARGAPRRSL